ncbi:MAG TPA: hypothetical protein VG275_06950 [Solirubrobacteraceae bacterium]|jgi:hypothetical protein|nr:hypothetical protein [Solirubrobacteraceae bacterium]
MAMTAEATYPKADGSPIAAGLDEVQRSIDRLSEVVGLAEKTLDPVMRPADHPSDSALANAMTERSNITMRLARLAEQIDGQSEDLSRLLARVEA